MNVWTELAEKVHNPNFQTGADIQKQLDIFSKLQGPNIQSNIGYAVPGMGDQGGGVEAPSQSAWGGDDPNFGSILLGSFLGPWAAKFAGGQQGLTAYNEAFPSPITPFGKMLSYAPKLGGKVTGLPDTITNLIGRQAWNPFISAMEGLLGYGKNYYSSMPNIAYSNENQQFEVDRTINPWASNPNKATPMFSGIGDISNIFGAFLNHSMSTPTGQQAFVDAYSPGIQLGSIEAAMLGYTQPFVDTLGFPDTLGIGGLTGGTSIGGTTDGAGSVGSIGGIDGGPGNAY